MFQLRLDEKELRLQELAKSLEITKAQLTRVESGLSQDAFDSDGSDSDVEVMSKTMTTENLS